MTDEKKQTAISLPATVEIDTEDVELLEPDDVTEQYIFTLDGQEVTGA